MAVMSTSDKLENISVEDILIAIVAVIDLVLNLLDVGQDVHSGLLVSLGWILEKG